MPASDSPAVIVARFLKANRYEKTLDAFLEEAGLPPDAGTLTKDCLTIERILEEKKIFDMSLAYEKTEAEKTKGWTIPAPTHPTVVNLPEATNILSVSVQIFCLGRSNPTLSLLATTAGRRLTILQADASLSLIDNLSPQDSPILSWVPIYDGTYSIGTAMSGQTILFGNVAKDVISERRDHTKYVVKTATYTLPGEGQPSLIATAGWDAKVFLYYLPYPESSVGTDLPAPIGTLNLPSNPEDLLFYPSPTEEDPGRIILIVTRRDSTHLHFYTLPDLSSSPPSVPTNLSLLGRQNLAPHASAWTIFSPSCIALCPTDSSLLAVATSSLPSLKLLLVRLLIPTHPVSSEATSTSSAPIPLSTSTPLPGDPTQASAARAALAEQDHYAGAILLHVSTQATQTAYSTPRCAWRPDGSGVWVNGDDGVVRGVERGSGKVVEVLREGHEAGKKVRDLWAGWVDIDTEDGGKRREEWVVSGGFDRRIVVWKVKNED